MSLPLLTGEGFDNLKRLAKNQGILEMSTWLEMDPVRERQSEIMSGNGGGLGGWGGLSQNTSHYKRSLSLRRQREIYNGIQRKENGSYFRVLCTKMSKDNQNLISGFFSS